MAPRRWVWPVEDNDAELVNQLIKSSAGINAKNVG